MCFAKYDEAHVLCGLCPDGIKMHCVQSTPGAELLAAQDPVLVQLHRAIDGE